MNRIFFWNKICGFVLLLTFSCLLCKAQRASLLIFRNKDSIHSALTAPASFPVFHKIDPRAYASPREILPANFATCSYGFFCRQELKFEKATRLPVRVRIGSLEQCNYYEGKEGNSLYYGFLGQ